MELRITTIIEDHSVLSGHGYTTSDYAWECPSCGQTTRKSVRESISYEYNTLRRKTEIYRTLELHNDGNDWLCDACKTPDAIRRRILLKKF